MAPSKHRKPVRQLEWDESTVAFHSPHRLEDLRIDQGPDLASPQRELKLGLAHTENRRKAASVLIEKMYSWRGYDSPTLGNDPNKITLVANQAETVVGTLTLGLDSPAGLVVDQLYKTEADRLRAQGRRLCDVTRLAVDPGTKSKHVLGALFHLSVIFGRNIHRATDFLIEIHPRHALFYQRMIGFEAIGEEKLCPRVNAPAVLLKLDLAYSDEQVKRHGGLGASAQGVRNMYPYWLSKERELGITRRLLWGSDGWPASAF